MKKCFTCPDLPTLSRTSSLHKVASTGLLNTSSLRQVKSQASITSSPVEAVDNIMMSSTASTAQIIQDISDPRGIASVICLEHYSSLEAPSLRSDGQAEKDAEEDLENCLHVPTEEDCSSASAIWEKVIARDVESTFSRHLSRKRRWQRAIRNFPVLKK